MLLELGIYRIEARFHLLTVREEGQGRAPQCKVRAYEQLLQRGKVCEIVRLGNVTRHVDHHVLVERVARSELQRR